jgi:hypothetical protein
VEAALSLPVLRRGAQGSAVKYLQERLTLRGFQVSTDGDFGGKTEDAVEQFQASERLTPDGEVGTLTWNRLLVNTRAVPPSTLLKQQRAALLVLPAGTPAKAAQALAIACGALGSHEIPGGSNSGPEIERFVGGYNAYWQINDTVGRPWCVMFVASSIALGLGMKPNPAWGDWRGHPWFSESGHPWGPKKPGGAFRGSSVDVEEWAKAASRWVAGTSGAVAPAGAFFTMTRATSGSDAASGASAGHTGLIVCDNGDGTVTTIEGNVSDQVGSHKRKKSDLRGWATWW